MVDQVKDGWRRLNFLLERVGIHYGVSVAGGLDARLG